MCWDCVVDVYVSYFVFFFKQKTAYELRISDWSSDVCSSDLDVRHHPVRLLFIQADAFDLADLDAVELHFRADAQTPDRTVEDDAIGLVGSSKQAAAEPDDEKERGYQPRGRYEYPTGIAVDNEKRDR